MPGDRSTLIGRRSEVEAIGDLLRTESIHLVTLTGPGGVGKTRLARSVGEVLAKSFADGVRFVELASITDVSGIPVTIARACGLVDQGTLALSDRLAGFLSNRQTLIILDNLEHLPGAGPVVADLMRACPQLKLLVTSRDVLNLSAEYRFPVQPLATPDAVHLFVTRAQAVQPGFALTAENAAIISAVCARLDGLPLAVELAAARTRSLPLDELLTLLDSSLNLLTGGPRDRPDRHRTIRNAIAWSVDLLDEPERNLLARMSVFVDGFSLEAATRTTGGGDVDVLDQVSSLVRKSLLGPVAGSDPEPRFRMLEVVREYGRELLAEQGNLDRAKAAQAYFMLDVAERAGFNLFSPDYVTLMARLDRDHANIRAALACFATIGDFQAMLRLARAMSDYWMFRGHIREGRAWLAEALEHAEPEESVTMAGALASIGWMCVFAGDLDAGERWHYEARALAKRLKLTILEAVCCLGLALGALMRGNWPDAARLSDEAIALGTLGESTADVGPYWKSLCIGNRAEVAKADQDFDLAAEMSAKSVELQRRLGFSWGLADNLRIVADVRSSTNDFNAALDAYRECLELSAIHQDARLLTDAVLGIGIVAGQRGLSADAIRLFGGASSLREFTGLSLKPWDVNRHDRALANLKQVVLPAEFDRLWAEGAFWTRDQVVENAFRFASVSIDESGGDDESRFTPREREVLTLLIDGLSDKEIGDRMSISPRTVGGHVSHILDKLGVESRTAAVAAALRRGVV